MSTLRSEEKTGPEVVRAQFRTSLGTDVYGVLVRFTGNGKLTVVRVWHADLEFKTAALVRRVLASRESWSPNSLILALNFATDGIETEIQP